MLGQRGGLPTMFCGGGGWDSFARFTRCASQTSRFWTDVVTQREHVEGLAACGSANIRGWTQC